VIKYLRRIYLRYAIQRGERYADHLHDTAVHALSERAKTLEDVRRLYIQLVQNDLY
jgi:hypothetical protein